MTSTTNIPSQIVCGFPVYDGTAADLVDDLFSGLDQGRRASIFAINPKKVILADSDPEFEALLRGCDVRIPDGSGILLSARLDGQPAMKRVTGLDLMLKICRRAEGAGRSVYLFGGRPGVVDAAGQRLLNEYPTLRIAGISHGYHESWDEMVETIGRSEADILFVGLGSPLQERFIDYAFPRLPGLGICLGVGGSYDVISGNIPRAPVWARKLRLEWLFRMIRQPRRIRENRFLLDFVTRLARQIAQSGPKETDS